MSTVESVATFEPLARLDRDLKQAADNLGDDEPPTSFAGHCARARPYAVGSDRANPRP